MGKLKFYFSLFMVMPNFLDMWFKIDSFKIDSFKIDSFKIDSFKIDSFKIDSFKIDSFKIEVSILICVDADMSFLNNIRILF